MEASAATLRAELFNVLSAREAECCDGLRAELARPVTIEVGRRLQFEIDPQSWGVSSCATEELIIGDWWLYDSLPGDWLDRAEALGVNWDALFSNEVCPWFATCWRTVGGPTRFSPAYLFIHDYHDTQYDLERTCWIPAAVAFGE